MALREGEDPGAMVSRFMTDTHIACSDDAAYVVTAYDAGPATVDVYRQDGSTDTVAVPPEDASGVTCTNQETGRPCPHWSRRARVSIDEQGNLVILGSDANTHGAIINPETGCYALIRAERGRRLQPVTVRENRSFHLLPTVRLHSCDRQVYLEGAPQ